MSSTGVSSNNIATALVAEMEHEAGVTRSVLERIPPDKFDWKPHEKSMTFGRLASHVAEMFAWTPSTLEHAELDFSKMDYKPFEPKTTEELVEFLDKNVAEAIASLKASSDERFMETWTMRNGETVYFTMPKVAVMRSFVMNHIIHHRGQLSVYLRLNDTGARRDEGHGGGRPLRMVGASRPMDRATSHPQAPLD